MQAATIAGLSYLQHIVTMPAGERPAADPGDPAEAPPTTVGGGFHDRVHGDILVFHRSQGTGGADA